MSIKKITLTAEIGSEEYKEAVNKMARRVRPGNAVVSTSADYKRRKQGLKEPIQGKRKRKKSRKPSPELLAFAKSKDIKIPSNASAKTAHALVDAWRDADRASKKARKKLLAYVKKVVILRRTER